MNSIGMDRGTDGGFLLAGLSKKFSQKIIGKNSRFYLHNSKNFPTFVTSKEKDMEKPRNWNTEKPEPMRLIVVTDNKGNYQGHLGTKLVFDGERIVTDLAHSILVDTDNIVSWFYLSELREF